MWGGRRSDGRENGIKRTLGSSSRPRPQIFARSQRVTLLMTGAVSDSPVRYSVTLPLSRNVRTHPKLGSSSFECSQIAYPLL